MLKDDFERAEAEPSKDYHLSYTLNSIFRRLRERDVQHERLESNLSEFDQSHPLIDVIKPLQRWVEDREYEDGAKKAVSLFEDAYVDARQRDWHNIAILCLQQLVLIQKETGGKEIEVTVEKAVKFLEQDFNANKISVGNFHTLVDLVVENRKEVDDSLIQRCIDECEIRRRLQSRSGQYRNERSTLEKILRLKGHLNKDIESERERLIDSFESEIERPSRNSLKAALLNEALNRCISFIDKEKKQDWKRDIRRYNRRAVRSEFAEISLDDEQATDLQQEGEENIRRLKQFFQNIPIEPHSSTYALYCLLKSDGYLPSYELSQSVSEEYSITDVIPRITLSQEGDPIQTTESSLEDTDRLPNSYPMMVRHNNAILANTLYELIEEDALHEMDFIHLLNICQNLRVSDEAFLLDLIIAVFEERYPEAVHLGTPLIERVTTRLLENSGEAVTALKQGNIEQRSLGGLFDSIQEQTSTDFGMYLKARYTEKSALNLRNKVSHGQISYVECQFGNAALLLFDIFRIMVNISEAEYTAVFGPPVNTISKNPHSENYE
jgi:hypothetical protein